jgi:hypothetical protein
LREARLTKPWTPPVFKGENIMAFEEATRKKAKLRLALCGPSGSGKTYSALLIARGLGTGKKGEIAVADTEHGSAELYADLVPYSVQQIHPPYTPDKYTKAIKEAEAAGFKVLILDSLTHAWAGEGGFLDQVDKRKAAGGNQFAPWREVTPQHNRLIDTILGSSLHIIVTMRSKTVYEVTKNSKGKAVPVKVGTAPIMREGVDYEFTVVFDMAIDRHIASTSKDRTSLFDGDFFTPEQATGKKLLKWLNSGATPAPIPSKEEEDSKEFDALLKDMKKAKTTKALQSWAAKNKDAMDKLTEESREGLRAAYKTLIAMKEEK